MKKIIFLAIFSMLASFAMSEEKKETKKKANTKEILANILSNTGGGYSYDVSGDGKSQGFWVSTGYTFKVDKKLSVSPQFVFNWDNYSCGDYSASYKSIRIPVKADYVLLSNSTIALSAYGGVDAEYIMRVSSNNYDANIRPFQCSVFAGASGRIANVVSVSVGYRVGLLSFYEDGTGRNKGFEFSFNF